MTQLDNLISEAQGIIHMMSGQKLWGLFSGGKDSIAACHVVSQMSRLEGVIHIRTKTGPASEMGSDYALSVARGLGWRIIEKSPATSYVMLVSEFGFPGPAQHHEMYKYLKERPLREAAKSARKKSGKSIGFVSGIRKAESQRRMRHADDIHKQDGIYWINPLINWRTEDVMEYLKLHNLDTLIRRKSRECLCGAFAKPGEKDEITQDTSSQGQYWYHLEQMVKHTNAIRDLAGEKSIPDQYCVWGHGLGSGDVKQSRSAKNVLSICSVCEGQLNEAGHVGIDPDAELLRVRESA